MVWREEELLATEIIANITRGYGHFFMVSRGRNIPTTQTIYRLMFERGRKKVYLSFPMSHVMDLPDTLAEIDAFKATINQHFICFDPADVDEFVLHTTALKAMQEGQTTIEVQAAEGPITLKTADVAQISGDIMGQIYARDFKMVDQSDMIVSLVPELPNGKPGLSSGVERELHHAFEGGKEVYVVWTCKAMPCPFITETATKVFRSTAEAHGVLQAEGVHPVSEAAAVVGVLEYASPMRTPLTPAWRTKCLRFVMAFWLIPLVVGTIIFLLAKVAGPTGFDTYAGAGLITILGGTALASVGGLLILVFVGIRWSVADNRWREVIAPALLASALLLSNFGVAMLFISFVDP